MSAGVEEVIEVIYSTLRQKMNGGPYMMPPDVLDEAASAILAALHAAGFVVVPVEPTIEMIQDGCDAARASRSTGTSGMTIEAQTRNLAHREIAAYRAMLAAAATPR